MQPNLPTAEMHLILGIGSRQICPAREEARDTLRQSRRFGDQRCRDSLREGQEPSQHSTQLGWTQRPAKGLYFGALGRKEPLGAFNFQMALAPLSPGESPIIRGQTAGQEPISFPFVPVGQQTKLQLAEKDNERAGKVLSKPGDQTGNLCLPKSDQHKSVFSQDPGQGKCQFYKLLFGKVLQQTLPQSSTKARRSLLQYFMWYLSHKTSNFISKMLLVTPIL